MSPCIMGLTTQGPYIQKEHTKLYKILRFRVNWANIEQDTAIQRLQNLLTNVWIAGHLPGNPYISECLLIMPGFRDFNSGSIENFLCTAGNRRGSFTRLTLLSGQLQSFSSNNGE